MCGRGYWFEVSVCMWMCKYMHAGGINIMVTVMYWALQWIKYVASDVVVSMQLFKCINASFYYPLNKVNNMSMDE